MIELIVVVVVIGLLSYMFGFWDHLADRMGVTVPWAFGLIIGGIVFIGMCIIVGAVGTHFALTYVPKLFGHTIFGG